MPEKPLPTASAEPRATGFGSTLPLDPRYRIGAELITLIYIAIIAVIAIASGAIYVLFPELGALSHDVFTRPRGTWARSPVLLVITPALTAVVGIFFTRVLPYGYLSVLLTVGGAVAIIELLHSPIAPAISAGLLPLVLGVRSWMYPPGILLGTVLLAAVSEGWRRFCHAYGQSPVLIGEQARMDLTEEPPGGYRPVVALMLFVAVAVFFVEITGLRFILFPPLVVIGFEMLAHPRVCPWVRKPLWLPLVCFLTGAGGLISWRLFGVSPLAAGASVAWGVIVLRIFDLHIPPAFAIALLPLVMTSPGLAYPFSVGAGTILMTLWFLAYRRLTPPVVHTPSTVPLSL
ncbi:MAG TPA: HPP family protein [Candidatus Binataceae bacterium]|nr:HPP family protein [Candidatus Binataceae bacterium]